MMDGQSPRKKAKMGNPKLATEYRNKGNQFYVKSKEAKALDDQKKYLHQAIDWYERSRDQAGNEMDLSSSAYKNMGVCYATLETIETNKKTELYYLKQAGRAMARALENGEHAKKTTLWLNEVMKTLESTVDRYLRRSDELVEDAIDGIMECVKADVKNQEYHFMVSKHRTDQAERILNKCMELIGDRQYLRALPTLRGLNYYIEEARRHGKGKPELIREVDVIEEECVCFTELAEGLQCYKLGEDVLESIKQADGAVRKASLGLAALDHFKQSEVMARGQDVELVAMAQTKIGITLIEAFSFTQRAQLCFKEAINVSTTLFGNLHNRPWYIELTTAMQRIRDEELRKENERWENRRKPFLDELKPELEKLATIDDKSADEIINFIWDNFKPKHIENPKKPDGTSVKKRLLKANQLYNPDKIDEEKYGTKYKVMCEEILKVINRRYNYMKMAD